MEKYLPYPYNLVMDILQIDAECGADLLKKAFNIEPDRDFEPSVEYMLNTLPNPTHVTWIHLRYKEGMTLRQIGEQFDRHPETVRQRIEKSLRRLRQYNRLDLIRFGGIRGLLYQYDKLPKLYPHVQPIGTSLDDIQISTRTYNVLKRAGIDTLEDAQDCTFSQLCNLPKMGKACMRELIDILKEHDIEIPHMTEYDRSWLFGNKDKHCRI